jgi:DNA-binding transcriptional regulator YiaG
VAFKLRNKGEMKMTPEQFKAKRNELGLTQSQLADILGMSGKNADLTVRRWEMPATANGARPPNPMACKILLNWNTPPSEW